MCFGVRCFKEFVESLRVFVYNIFNINPNIRPVMPVFKSIDISVIIPAKDEELRLPSFLDQLADYCQQSQKSYEIIVVDDGSRDNTSEVVEQFKNKFEQLKLIRLIQNRGKGYAIRSGFFEASGEILIFMDADGSTPPEAIAENLCHFDAGVDIVIGSRVLGDAQHQIQAKWYRRKIGEVFNFFVHLFLFEDIEDTQCGFKMFRRTLSKPLFARMKIYGFGFDLEILYLAKKLGYIVKEVPVNWHHVDASKTHLVIDSCKMFVNILQVWWRYSFAAFNKAEHLAASEAKEKV